MKSYLQVHSFDNVLVEVRHRTFAVAPSSFGFPGRFSCCMYVEYFPAISWAQ